MGLGKTLQIVAFVEILLRVTSAKKVLIICPINVINNWKREFDKWLPEKGVEGRALRSFPIHLLGDSVKSTNARIQLIGNYAFVTQHQKPQHNL